MGTSTQSHPQFAYLVIMRLYILSSVMPYKTLNAHFYLCFCGLGCEAERPVMIVCRAGHAEWASPSC